LTRYSRGCRAFSSKARLRLDLSVNTLAYQERLFVNGLTDSRITQLVKENKLWFLLQLDTIVIYYGNLKRYILTAVDHSSKFGYARMYKSHSSKAAADFLYRLQYLINQRILNLQTDNGSEFVKYFEQVAITLGIDRYFSRVRTPKDNPEREGSRRESFR